jgi:hypothetical protein
MMKFPWGNPVKPPPPSLSPSPHGETREAEVRRYKSARVRKNISSSRGEKVQVCPGSEKTFKQGRTQRASPRGPIIMSGPSKMGLAPILSLVSPLIAKDDESFKGKRQRFARNVLGHRGCYKRGYTTQQQQIHTPIRT